MNISICSEEGSELVGLLYKPSDPTAEEIFFDVNLLSEFIQTPLTGHMKLNHIESDDRMLSYSSVEKSDVIGSPSECQSCGIEFGHEITLGESPIEKRRNLHIISICIECARKLQYNLYMKLQELSEEIAVNLL